MELLKPKRLKPAVLLVLPLIAAYITVITTIPPIVVITITVFLFGILALFHSNNFLGDIVVKPLKISKETKDKTISIVLPYASLCLFLISKNKDININFSHFIVLFTFILLYFALPEGVKNQQSFKESIMVFIVTIFGYIVTLAMYATSDFYIFNGVFLSLLVGLTT